MEYSAAEKAIIWLCSRPEFDSRTRAALLRASGDPARIFSDFEKICSQVIHPPQNGLYKGDRTSRGREAENLVAALREKGYFAVTAAGAAQTPAPGARDDPPPGV